MSRRVLYVCSARCFRSDRPRPKIQGVVNVWRELGYDVEHLSGGDLYESSATIEDDIKAKVEFHQKWYRDVSFMSPFVQSCSERRDIRHNRLMKERLTALVEAKRPDVIWERSSRLSIAGLTVAKRYGITFVHEWRDHLIPYRFSLYHRRAINIEKQKNEEADFIVVESQKLKDDLTSDGINPDKILIAYNAVNPHEFVTDARAGKEYRHELGVKDDQVLIGYLGSYAFYHDMVRIVLAADILRNQKVSNVKILLVGTGKQYEETRRLAERLNLLDLIIMKPWVPKEVVPEVLSALDIAVLPGCTDIICPIKVQEYMVLELPAVIPDYSCNREVITDGVTGVLFKPHDEQDLASKLMMLANDSRKRITIGKNARQEVCERFTWEKTWGCTLGTIFGKIR